MRAHALIVRSRVIAIAAILTLAPVVESALAGPGGGGHGGGGGAGHGGGGFHRGFGGYRGGPGRGGYHGWHGGWHSGYYGGGYGRWRGGWGGWGWGGIGLGWYLPVLPWGYETLWWGDVPYYYADNSYYAWDDSVGEYQAVEPPSDLSPTAPAGLTLAPNNPVPEDPMITWDLFAYPKGGQSVEQQTRDRDECRKWAVGQTGFDPAQKQPDDAKDIPAKRQSYLRAEAACLEGRNYSVK